MTSEVTLPTLYQQQIHMTKYSRWIEEKGRRELWHESVERYIQAMMKRSREMGYNPTSEEEDELRQGILHHRALGSMRALMTAGPALDRDHVAGYNCAYTVVDDICAFPEAMFILMCGTGVGYSVEQDYVEQLPVVPARLRPSSITLTVRDSKRGWAEAFETFLGLLYQGWIPNVDVSGVRPAGARLKTFGGRASGPEPLLDLFRYVVEIFKAACGRKLTSRECHGIMCKIGDIVVVGGVRRSALICLSDLDDADMREAKSGTWWVEHPEYALANISAVYDGRPSEEIFWHEWNALRDSGSGERGIVNRRGMTEKVAENGRRDTSFRFGTNPCSEIILRPKQFCNLSEVVARREDTLETLAEKVRLATIFGAIQSTFTDFRYLSDEWKQNCEDERLLGVSITGIMDNLVLAGREGSKKLRSWLRHLKAVAIETAKEWAAKLGINLAAAITCVKPSGTVSQLVDAASGIHPRYSKYYVRTNRASKNDPVAQFLAASGIPVEDEILHPDSTLVFSYPMKAPEGAITRDDMTAIEQLELWLVYAEEWCEHKPSITVYVRPDEWEHVGRFVYEHFDRMSGVSFLPHSEHNYQQAPYQEIDKETYERLLDEFPDKLYWEILHEFETEDSTEGMKELACVADACELP